MMECAVRQADMVDRESHGEGMDGFTGDDPQTFTGSEALSSQQALVALGTAIGDFHAGGKAGLARDVQDLHADIRGRLGAWSETTAQP